MKIALVYNLKKDPAIEGRPIDYYSEFDSRGTVEAIAAALRSCDHEISFIEAEGCIIDKLSLEAPDIVFNIAEGSAGPNREAHVPAILDYLGIPYTGSGVLALAVSLDKTTAKNLFMQEGISTPKFQLIKSKNTPIKKDLKFPMIVKPNSEGSAKGITKDSVVYNNLRLYQEIDKIIDSYKQGALIEEFIEGKELTVGILGNERFFDMPVLEIDFSDCRESGEYFYSWHMKEYQGNKELGLVPKFFCPARLNEELANKVKDAACRAHKAIGCSDFSRVDIRLGNDNIPYVLEVNPLPGLDPVESNFPIIAKAAGIDYNELITIMLELAVSRYRTKGFSTSDAPARRIVGTILTN